MKPLQLGTQSNPGRFAHGGVCRHINCRVETPGEESRYQIEIHVAQGFERWATLTNGGGIRDMIATESECLVMADRYLYSLDGDGNATEIDSIPVDGDTFMMANGRESGSQIGIVCSGSLYIFDTTARTLTRVTDPDLLANPPYAGCYLGGYFWMVTEGGKFIWTELDTGDSVDGLSVGTARSRPDSLVTCAARSRDLLLFGKQSLEVWTLNDGTGDAPVSLRSTIQFGAVSRKCVATVGDTVYWLATTNQGAYAGLHTLAGDTPTRIAHPAFDRVVQDEPYKSHITCTHWTEDGRTEIAWTGTGWTWVLDLATGKMHERSSGGINNRWRIASCVQFADKIIAGDYENPYLYTLSKAHLTEDGEDLTMIVQPPPIHAQPQRVELNEVELNILPGQGLPGSTYYGYLNTETGQRLALESGSGALLLESARLAIEDISPAVWLKVSMDGLNWSEPITREIGKEGQRLSRAVWHALGTSHNAGWHLQFGCSAAVHRTFYGASADWTLCKP